MSVFFFACVLFCSFVIVYIGILILMVFLLDVFCWGFFWWIICVFGFVDF